MKLMALLDSKQEIELNLETQKPIEVKLKIGSKVTLVIIIVSTMFFVSGIKKARIKRGK